MLIASFALVAIQAAPPVHAAVTAQCDGVYNTGGLGMSCDITVENFLDLATGDATSRVTTLACSGDANVDPLPTCVGPTVTEYPELTTSANQCNGSANGGGATMYCTITVINTITGEATTSAAPINQCVGSLDTGDVRACTPDPATSDASVDGVTQCNGSVNGGGGSMTCTVSPSTTSNSAFAFLTNQCNDSANGGGAVIVCAVDISTLFLAVEDDEGDEGEQPEVETPENGQPENGQPENGQPEGTPIVNDMIITEETLPPTGADVTSLMALAVALLLAGSSLAVAASRRRALAPVTE